ncbi:hypothetical protein [Agarivorans sp. JK6]|uniref:hypothetical protein n=1 Tax=Agarivorans sp. JK6 TaxID=2997426 RepID=UPI003873445B
MNLQLDIEALQLGEYSDSNAIFGLSDDEIAATVSIKGEQALRHYSFHEADRAKLAKLKVDADAVFVLLPEAPLEQAKSQVYQDTLALVPQLAHIKKVYLFPYGRCAMQLALRQALKLFNQQLAGSIQVLAYHQDERLAATQALEQTASIASECFIAARLQPAKRGFAVPWASYEVQTSDKSIAATVAALIQRYRGQCGQELTQCYMPSALSSELMDGWLAAFQCFENSVGSRSQVIFADARVGDLAACTGLFNLCHLFTHYQQQKHAGLSFQLDISDQTYRSAMMLAWVA